MWGWGVCERESERERAREREKQRDRDRYRDTEVVNERGMNSYISFIIHSCDYCATLEISHAKFMLLKRVKGSVLRPWTA